MVLSDETLDNLATNDPVSAARDPRPFRLLGRHRRHQGRRADAVLDGHGFCGIGRKQLLLLLQERARELGVELRFETEVESARDYMADYDLVVAADGLNSKTRNEFADTSSPRSTRACCKFIWLGTHQKFDDAFTFIFEKTEHGWVWAHAYQFDADTATFIVEMRPRRPATPSASAR